MFEYSDTESLVDALTHDCDSEPDSIFNPNKRKKKISAADLEDSSWGLMLRNPETKDPRTFLGSKFRLRFRTPYPIFEYIVQLCEVKNVFNLRLCPIYDNRRSYLRLQNVLSKPITIERGLI